MGLGIVTIECPFCGGQVHAESECARPFVAHTVPVCPTFSRLDPQPFLEACVAACRAAEKS